MKKYVLLLLLGFAACNYDSIVVEEPECTETVTYEMGARDIINFSCATVGCHVAGGDGVGDYSSYSSMRSWLTDEFFKKVVLDGSMPPIGSPELTDQDREALQCWIEADYPEN